MFGLNMLLAGVGRGFQRRVSSRRERKFARQETAAVAKDRNGLAKRLEQEHAARVRVETINEEAVTAPAASATQPAMNEPSSAVSTTEPVSERRGGLRLSRRV